MTNGEDVTRMVHPPLTATPPPAATLWTVQVLRGLAALMVVVGHSQSAVGTAMTTGGAVFVRSTLVPWGAGVDLFFVISGFIMVHASGRLFGRRGGTVDFLRRRLVRIVPLYWLVTTMFLALLAAASLKGGDAFPGPAAILASYAFLPFDTWGDGRLFPVLDLGWTLNYEMFFYAVFVCAVALPRGRALGAIGVLIVVLVALGTALSQPSALWFWTRPIMLDFGLGVLVGAVAARGIVLPATLRGLVAVAALALLLVDPTHVFDGAIGTTVPNAWPRVAVAGLPIAVILATAVLGREPRMPRFALPLTRTGDASYSLYLFHPFALIATEKLIQKVPAVLAIPAWIVIVATIALALVIAFAAFRWIERPMTAALSRRLIPRPSKPILSTI